MRARASLPRERPTAWLSQAATSAVLLLGLLFGLLALMSYQVNQAITLTATKRTVLAVASPAQRLLSATWLGAASAWSTYVRAVANAREIDAMGEEIALLRRQNDLLDETRRENLRLRALLKLRNDVGTDAQAAEVIGRDLAHRFESVVINRGSLDGVKLDSPALARDGSLIGRVVTVAPWTSMVQLVTAPFSAAGAQLVVSRVAGVALGEGTSQLRLQYISSREEVSEGDLVVTSGTDGLFPSGLPIGTISSVALGPPVPGTPHVPLVRNETALFLEITISPRIDLQRLEEVLLLAPAEDLE